MTVNGGRAECLEKIQYAHVPRPCCLVDPSISSSLLVEPGRLSVKHMDPEKEINKQTLATHRFRLAQLLLSVFFTRTRYFQTHT